MMTLLRKAFWVALFAAFTLGFVTFFDHGFTTARQFSTDAQGEAHDLVVLWRPVNRPPDKSDETGK